MPYLSLLSSVNVSICAFLSPPAEPMGSGAVSIEPSPEAGAKRRRNSEPFPAAAAAAESPAPAATLSTRPSAPAAPAGDGLKRLHLPKCGRGVACRHLTPSRQGRQPSFPSTVSRSLLCLGCHRPFCCPECKEDHAAACLSGENSNRYLTLEQLQERSRSIIRQAAAVGTPIPEEYQRWMHQMQQTPPGVSLGGPAAVRLTAVMAFWLQFH